MLKFNKVLNKVWIPVISRRYTTYPISFTYHLQNLPATQYTKLSNGVTIATEERESCNACVGLFMDAGSRYESNTENGVAHFFEHLAFKGTHSRCKSDLATQMACLGAKYKCFTTREMVAYYVECLSADTLVATEILIDCIFNNSFDKAEIEQEKQIVYLEMIDHDNDPHKVVFDYLHASAFQGTPLAQTVMGPSSNLYNFTDSTICRYLSKCFDPGRTVLAAVGGIKHERLVELAKSYLCKLEPLNFEDMDTYRYTGSDVRFRDDSMPTAHVVIAVEGPSFSDDDRVVMEVARFIMGGWDRSQPGGLNHPARLARTITRGNLCDSYQAFNLNYKDCGLFGVHFVADTMHQDDIMMSIQEEFMYLSMCVTKTEVDRAKNFLKAKILSETESSLGACMDIGRCTLYYGCRPSLPQKMDAVDSVTIDQVRRACYQYLFNQCPVVAAVGPTEGLFEYPRIRSYMYWSRV
ncbi:cytochrome b-c1 complex subunit 1, mitochondrial-like [Spodoptera frugiperda]|uniref:Cytochrome b-c1 complex subunit 1, mitochondrial-like n=1 Tax=Spodoptera frugiperda TaxID=7108 RepID=A0A9R0D0Q8_SPOFR|nr:cytochrome b-c1 complex subunit 1, mitochondrial-like [Spodoptera frugiperda]